MRGKYYRLSCLPFFNSITFVVTQSPNTEWTSGEVENRKVNILGYLKKIKNLIKLNSKDNKH